MGAAPPRRRQPATTPPRRARAGAGRRSRGQPAEPQSPSCSPPSASGGCPRTASPLGSALRSPQRQGQITRRCTADPEGQRARLVRASGVICGSFMVRRPSGRVSGHPFYRARLPAAPPRATSPAGQSALAEAEQPAHHRRARHRLFRSWASVLRAPLPGRSRWCPVRGARGRTRRCTPTKGLTVLPRPSLGVYFASSKRRAALRG